MPKQVSSMYLFLLFIYFKNATRFKLLHAFNINISTHFSKPASSHDTILRNVQKTKEKLLSVNFLIFFSVSPKKWKSMYTLCS